MIRAALLWPPLRGPAIVPWGRRYLADFIARHNPEARLAVWDLSEDPEVTELWERAAQLHQAFGVLPE